MADLRTAAEIAYDLTRLSRLDPWAPVLDITDNPTNDGRARTDSQILDILTDDDDGSDDDDARELVPVPPVPAGYSTDRALIYQTISGVFLCIDRRDGEMVICEKDKIATDDNSFILPPAYMLALAQFLNQADIRELVAYHRAA
jgi:hypothetical protein